MAEDDGVREARELYERARDAESHNRRTALEAISFARAGDQWPANIKDQRQREGRPCLTINRLLTFIRQVVNDSRQNKPAIKVRPADSKADPKTAEVIAGLIRNIEYISNADVAYDTAVECAVTGGFGYLRVVMDYATDDSFDLDLLIKRVNNPFSVYGDPDASSADGSDWNCAFVVDRLTKAAYRQKYKKNADGEKPVDWDDDAWSGLRGTDWRDDKTCLIAEHWEREEVEKMVVRLQDGTIIPIEQMQSPEMQALLATGAVQVQGEKKVRSHKVTQKIMSGLEVLEENEWPGRYIPIIPVYGDEFDIEGKRYFRGLVHNAIDAQRSFNYWRSAATELVALAPRVPYIGPKGAFDHDQERWQTANTRSHPYLEYEGEIPPQRQPLDMGAAAGALQEAMNASDDIKSTMGMYDASLGARSNETSGRAIMARQQEGDVATFHFVDNLSRAIRQTGRVLIDLIPHVYTGQRVLRVLGEDDSEETVPINKEYEAPVHDEVTGQEIGKEIRMHDLAAGKYDLTVSTGPSYTTRREEAVAAMTEMIRAYPPAAPIIGPELARNMDWPGADKIADKMEAQASGQLPPEVEKMAQEAQAKIAQLEEENARLKQNVEAEYAKIEVNKQIKMAEIASEREIAMMKIESEQAIAAHKAKLQADAMKERPAPERSN